MTQFGIDENNMIIEGNGRYEALKQLGIKKIPCIELKNMTEEQKKAYILVHNKLNMDTGFDVDILNDELLSIDTINMSDFDLEIKFDDIFKENERHRTNDTYNLGIMDNENVSDFWQMPIIKNDNFIPSKLIGFNYAKTSKEKNVGIHFYLDDYQFERLWNNPEEYIDILKQYECILSPDFSLYMDMPMPMKIWNIYRSRLIGQYYQNQGIKVIPTLSWAEEETFEAHLIALYKTYNYYNKSKANWGLNEYLPNVESWWKPTHYYNCTDMETYQFVRLIRKLIKLGKRNLAFELLNYIEIVED